MSTTKTPQAMYEELVAKIVEAVPEIRQARYIEGCQAGKQNCGKKGEDGEYLCTWCRQWNGEDRNEDVFRPITIEDVMRACPQIEEDYNPNCQCGCDNKDWRTLEIVNRWSLCKPLSEQSPDLHNFLHALLCNK